MQGKPLVKTKVDFITGSSLVGSVSEIQTAVTQKATITKAPGVSVTELLMTNGDYIQSSDWYWYYAFRPLA
jgi:hypothetical protein